jgi:hypothetical protein
MKLLYNILKHLSNLFEANKENTIQLSYTYFRSNLLFRFTMCLLYSISTICQVYFTLYLQHKTKKPQSYDKGLLKCYIFFKPY